MFIRMVSFLALSCALSTSFASEKSICGVDDRVPSTNPKVGRIIEKGATGGCTVTMIGKSCAISAGHCISTFEIAEFNTPPSRDGRIQHPGPEDIYEVDPSSIVYKNDGVGRDYAVLRLRANAKTGLYAGEVQGTYEVSFESPKVGEEIRITGYGLDYSDPDRNLAQQTHTGPITSLDVRGSTSAMEHRADTMGGNSGSSVISEETGKIVGIHTHGGCSTYGGSNSSTMIAGIPALVEAIKTCLADDKEL